MHRNYEDLTNAIIVQAAKDYQEVLKKLKKNPKSLKVEYEKLEIELFFFSSWFKSLTDLDPNMLIERLKEEIS